MPRSVASRRKQAENRKGIALIVGALAILGGVIGSYLYFNSGVPEVDKATSCPVEGPASITVLLLDVTDSLGAIQKADLKSLVDEVKESIPKYGRLDLYTVGVVASEPLKSEFVGCNPGSGRDVKSELTGNRNLADRGWSQRFSQRFDEVLDRIITTKPEDASPILESIQSVSVTSFEGAKNLKAPKRLVVVSDLIQYTKGLSFYTGAPTFVSFQKTQYYREVRTQLSGVDVTISVIPRQTKRAVQNAKLLDFWTAYFADQGATVSSWRPIKGGEH